MKPAFPNPAPTITAEFDHPITATLICDMDRYINGHLYMGLASVKAHGDGKEIGSLDTDVSGQWFVTFGAAHYKIDQAAWVGALLDAHEKRLAAEAE